MSIKGWNLCVKSRGSQKLCSCAQLAHRHHTHAARDLVLSFTVTTRALSGSLLEGGHCGTKAFHHSAATWCVQLIQGEEQLIHCYMAALNNGCRGIRESFVLAQSIHFVPNNTLLSTGSWTAKTEAHSALHRCDTLYGVLRPLLSVSMYRILSRLLVCYCR